MVLTGGSTAHVPEKQLVHGTKGFIFRVSNPKKNILRQISILGMGFEVFLSFFLGFFVILNFFCVTFYLIRLH